MNAIRDNNHIAVKLGVLCTDGVTLIPIAIDASGNVKVDTVSTVSVDLSTIDFRDSNYVPCWMGVNSITGLPCPIFVNASGAILVDE